MPMEEVLLGNSFPMYEISKHIGPKNHPNVGKYTIHGAYGMKEHRMDFLKEASFVSTKKTSVMQVLGYRHG